MSAENSCTADLTSLAEADLVDTGIARDELERVAKTEVESALRDALRALTAHFEP